MLYPKSIKIFGENGAWAYPGTAQFFPVPPIISGARKATDFKFGQRIQRVHTNKSPLKILEKRERKHIQGLPIFSGTPIMSGTGKLRISNLASTFRGSEQKPTKNFGEKGAWAYQGTAHFMVSPIISGTSKATSFKF